MARLLLIRRLLLGAVLLAGLGASASLLAVAPGPVFAATGDRWFLPGPPNSDDSYPAFYDVRRGATCYLVSREGDAMWTLTADTPRAWQCTFLQHAVDFRVYAPHVYDPGGDRVLFVDEQAVADDTCCTSSDRLLAAQVVLGSPPVMSALPVRGPIPAGRGGQAVVYDSRRQRLLAIGGRYVESDRYPSEVAALSITGDSASWATFNPASPALQSRSMAAVYDSLTDQVIVYGGQDSAQARNQLVRSLSLGDPTGWQTWSGLDSAATRQAAAFQPQIFLDAAHRRLLLVNAQPDPTAPGDWVDTYSADSVRVWSLDVDTRQGWAPVTYAGPSPVVSNGQVSYDPVRNRLSIYNCDGRDDLVELVLDGVSSWTMPQRSSFAPDDLTGVTAMFDRAHARVLYLSGGIRLFVGQRGPLDTWERPDVRPGGAPGYRGNSVAVYDSVGQRGLVFGGGDSSFELGDLWQFVLDDSNGVTWTRLFPDGDPPSPRWGAAAVYDPLRHRMVLFGGWAGRALCDTWELALDPPLRWHRLPDRGLIPGARFSATGVYDSRRDAMLLYGGDTGTPRDSQLSDETWAFSFADGDVWVPVPALGRPPAARAEHAAVYDSRRDRMIVFWGQAYYAARTDCDELDLADGPTWRTFAPTGPVLAPRVGSAAVYDPGRDQALLFGGLPGYPNTGGIFPINVYADFSANPVQFPPALSGPPLSVLGLVPNPTRDIENVAFDLPVDADVRGRIYDASGRLVRDLGPRRYVAGRHLLVWDGKNTAGAVPASGVYFARLSVLGKDFSGKFVLLH